MKYTDVFDLQKLKSLYIFKNTCKIDKFVTRFYSL